ncbi:uncharacterized protein LOC131933330 [Physella acuta]|uniref:uncharacterized protein LOC131933330 n=1 Tax=Physella acuta TaxID=109671 RepID=UPI0027DADECE|nr:uncharacterized protein LOC131933330 [Physella acuta]XP_059146097.1 uncharacterized protein LOC131933330 [Physella acuta]XP_059146098.1 uncharacterized protein LOC131933330 [Physella acuta]XP_059146100.1 uncharacterized protein LOC131933330 [Physella acuta]
MSLSAFQNLPRNSLTEAKLRKLIQLKEYAFLKRIEALKLLSNEQILLPTVKNSLPTSDIADKKHLENKNFNTKDPESDEVIQISLKNPKASRSRTESKENYQNLPTTCNVFSKLTKRKKKDSYSSQCEDLTALCSGITIVDKNTTSEKKTLCNPQTKPPIDRLSAARLSLNSAAVEYGKKSTAAVEKAHNRRFMGKDDARSTKVYLSEKQSGILSDCGMTVPCAPPATPTTEQLKKIEYIPSLKDVRSQRLVQRKLQTIEDRAAKKEKKKLEDEVKIDKMSIRDRKIALKKTQRQEIYALNKVMTDLENQKFIDFMESVEGT